MDGPRDLHPPLALRADQEMMMTMGMKEKTMRKSQIMSQRKRVAKEKREGSQATTMRRDPEKTSLMQTLSE